MANIALYGLDLRQAQAEAEKSRANGHHVRVLDLSIYCGDIEQVSQAILLNPSPAVEHAYQAAGIPVVRAYKADVTPTVVPEPSDDPFKTASNDELIAELVALTGSTPSARTPRPRLEAMVLEAREAAKSVVNPT